MIRVEGLVKRYRKLMAVDHLSFSIPEGSIFGLIGRNGAGKTTIMRILSTLLLPTGGRAEVGGFNAVTQAREVQRILGYMPDFFGVYDDLRVDEYLDFYASAHGVAPARRLKICSDLLELVDLGHKKDAYVDSLSRGMKQRLCLARAMVHDPKILILDEPASGLDPKARIEMRELLKELKKMGKTVVVSSHILSELSDLCTHIGIIEGGKMVTHGEINEVLHRRANRTIRIRLAGSDSDEVQRAEHLLSEQPELADLSVNGRNLTFRLNGSDDDLAVLLRRIVEVGLPVASYSETNNSLEDVFLRVTAEGA